MTTINRVMFALIYILLSIFSIGSARERGTIGIAVADMRPDLFSEITLSFEQRARARFIVRRVDAHERVGRQIAQIRTLIAQNAEAIIYVPAGATLSGVPVRDARRAHVPIVAVYGNPVDSPADTFIGTDNVTATKTLGRYMCATAHGTAKVGVIEGVIGMAPEVERAKGLREAVALCPGLSVVAEQSSSTWSRVDGATIARRMLKQHPEISIIFGQADLLALGAADAVHSTNLAHIVSIFGFDGDLAGLEAVRNGTLTATMAPVTSYGSLGAAISRRPHCKATCCKNTNAVGNFGNEIERGSINCKPTVDADHHAVTAKSKQQVLAQRACERRAIRTFSGTVYVIDCKIADRRNHLLSTSSCDRPGYSGNSGKSFGAT